MPRLAVTDRTGKNHDIDAASGRTVMEAARDARLLEGSCGGALACATCHIYIDPAWTDRLPAKSEDEEYLLDTCFDVRPTSRLGCQISISDTLNGLSFTVAA